MFAFSPPVSSRALLRRAIPVIAIPFVIIGLTAGCTGAGGEGRASSSPTDSASAAESGDSTSFPDVVNVEATSTGDNSFDFAVTISSPYDSPDQYADGWRVTTADGELLGAHVLTHDHASEQPFTRDQTGVKIPKEIAEVVVEGRDQANGYGGQTKTVRLPGR